MVNTTGTLNGTLIAQRTLETLLVKFPVLTQISTDFSPDGVLFNQQIISRVVQPTVATVYDVNTGYPITDRVNVDVPIKISSHINHAYSVNAEERSSTNLDLIQLWADTGAYALGRQIVDTLFGLVKAAAFPNSAPVAVGNFSRSALIDIRAKLNKDGVPDMGRFVCLNSDYDGALAKDTTIVANLYNRNADTITTGLLPEIHGMSLSEYAALPTNGENLVGIAGNKEALLVASRTRKNPSADLPLPGTIEVITDARTGLSATLEQWYDFKLGKEYRNMVMMFGVAVGISEADGVTSKRLIRITSA